MSTRDRPNRRLDPQEAGSFGLGGNGAGIRRTEETDAIPGQPAVSRIAPRARNDAGDGGKPSPSAAKNLERVADYTTNLAKTVYYVASGKRADKAVLKNDAS